MDSQSNREDVPQMDILLPTMTKHTLGVDEAGKEKLRGCFCLGVKL